MRTLDEALKYREGYPHLVRIVREVRYHAYVNGTQYALTHDWTIEALEEKLRMLEQPQQGGKE